MKKFYAVTKGIYSEYHIITITDNKENADRIAAAYDADIEEYEDNIVDPVGIWWVQRNEYKNGKTEWIASASDETCYGEDDVKRHPMTGNSSFGEVKGYWAVYVFAKDRSHAIKAGQDRYVQWKAEQEGIA